MPHLRHSPSRRGRSDEATSRHSTSDGLLSLQLWKPKRESAQQGACSRNWYGAATGGYIQDGRALGKREGKLAKIVIIGGGVIGSSIA